MSSEASRLTSEFQKLQNRRNGYRHRHSDYGSVVHVCLKVVIKENRWEAREALAEKLEREGKFEEAKIQRNEANGLYEAMQTLHHTKSSCRHTEGEVCHVLAWLGDHDVIERRFNMRQKLLRLTEAMEREDAILTRVMFDSYA